MSGKNALSFGQEASGKISHDIGPYTGMVVYQGKCEQADAVEVLIVIVGEHKNSDGECTSPASLTNAI